MHSRDDPFSMALSCYEKSMGVANRALGQAARRLAAYGPNRVPAVKPSSALRRFPAQFNDLLIYVLLASAAITLGLDHVTDAAVILGVVVINAIIGLVAGGPG